MFDRYPLNEYVSSGQLPLFVSLRSHHPNCDIHDHEYSEIVVIQGGAAQHAMDDRRLALRRGDVLVLHPGMHHGYCEVRDFELVNIGFDHTRLPLPALDGYELPFFGILLPANNAPARDPLMPVMTLNETELETILHLARQLHDELLTALPGSLFLGMAIFMQLIGELARFYRGEPSARTTRFSLGNAIKYISDHYAEPITVSDIARRAGVSERNLFRMFRTMTGRSPAHYLLTSRINRAAELLLVTDASLEEIAQSCGFCDANYLCRRFREIKGLSPRRFRLAHRREKPVR